MGISPTQRVEAGLEVDRVVRTKYVYVRPLWWGGQCGTQERFDLIVVLMSSYPLKPHCRLTSFQGIPLVCVEVVPMLLWLKGLSCINGGEIGVRAKRVCF